MHVAEVRAPRLHLLDVAKNVLAAELELPGNRVEAQLGDVGRDVCAEDVDLSQ